MIARTLEPVDNLFGICTNWLDIQYFSECQIIDGEKFAVHKCAIRFNWNILHSVGSLTFHSIWILFHRSFDIWCACYIETFHLLSFAISSVLFFPIIKINMDCIKVKRKKIIIILSTTAVATAWKIHSLLHYINWIFDVGIRRVELLDESIQLTRNFRIRDFVVTRRRIE